MPSFPPTPEQAEIIGAAASSTRSLMVSALAGCAKTTTLVMLSEHLPVKSVLALAFNKKIADELEKVLPPHFQVRTMNGLGHRAFSDAIGRRPILESNKLSKLITAWAKSSGGVSDDEWQNVRNLVAKARSSGLVPAKYPDARKALLPDDSWGWDSVADATGIDLTRDLVEAAREVLSQSIDMALQGTIDYDDQIFMSVLFRGLYPKFNTVLVDEAQDLSPLNHLQLKKLRPERLIVVGDPKQAIYAFRGADSSSMASIRGLREEWIDLNLSTTFRCPKAVVKRQLRHAPLFNAAESAPEGQVWDWRSEKEWTLINHIENVHQKDGQLHLDGIPDTKRVWIDIGATPSLAILCRNNAPLISMAFKLIAKRIGVNVLGRDFGKALSALLKKVCGENPSMPVEEVARRIVEWKEKEVRLARANDKEERVPRIQDQAESILAVCNSGEVTTLSEIKLWLTELFEEKTGQVTLSTGHKAKGLEWHTVIHLDPWRVPSKWARLAADDGNNVPMEQELNLKYVIETRAKHTLVLANLEQFS